MAKKNRKSKDIVCQKNDELEVDIIDMGTEGEGIGKVKGYPLFVKDAVIGDRVRVVVMKTKKNYGYARLLKIVKANALWQDNAVAASYSIVLMKSR
mgnify:CR=1 FL=1